MVPTDMKRKKKRKKARTFWVCFFALNLTGYLEDFEMKNCLVPGGQQAVGKSVSRSLVLLHEEEVVGESQPLLSVRETRPL